MREGRGVLDEPAVENRARNDSGKGTKPNFCFKKRGEERDGLVCRQGRNEVRKDKICAEATANVRHG